MGRKNSFFSLKSASLRTNRGMTLSEVLVVIAILGILILLVAFFIRPSFQIGKAKDAERKSDLKKLATVLEDYATDHKCYPLATGWQDALTSYLPQVPKDPKTKQPYIYTCPAEDCKKNNVAFGCTMFAIFTTLESEPGTSYSNGNNYVVTSPNYSLAPTSGPQFRAFGCYSYHCQPIPSPGIMCQPKYWNVQSCVGEGCCLDVCKDGHEYGCP